MLPFETMPIIEIPQFGMCSEGLLADENQNAELL